jgi:mannitol/fructose-specific phosphotransferase system IIA component (Ntr-type)
MRLPRYLKQDQVDLWFEPLVDTPDPWEVPSADELEESEDGELSERELWTLKERVIQHLAEMLERSGKITNPRKLFTDLRNREAKATTGIGRNIAMPHVRTNQAKGFAMAVAVAPEPGIPFDSIDEEPVRIFFAMVAPPYDDKYYLKVERALGAAFAEGDDLRDQLLEASSGGEVIRLLSSWIDD